MSRRSRQPFLPLENTDVQLMNIKIQLHRKLIKSYIDYDHYRAGAMPPGSVIMSQPWLTLGVAFSDISACDFVNLKSKLLKKYTIGRTNIDPLVPQFYEPREKEKRIFTKHMSTTLPTRIRDFRETPQSPKNMGCFDKDFLLDYPTILTNAFRK